MRLEKKGGGGDKETNTYKNQEGGLAVKVTAGKKREELHMT